MVRETRWSRIDPKFEKFLDDIKLEKIKNRTSRRMLSNRRLTKAITRLPNIEEIKSFMINAEINENE